MKYRTNICTPKTPKLPKTRTPKTRGVFDENGSCKACAKLGGARRGKRCGLHDPEKIAKRNARMKATREANRAAGVQHRKPGPASIRHTCSLVPLAFVDCSGSSGPFAALCHVPAWLPCTSARRSCSFTPPEAERYSKRRYRRCRTLEGLAPRTKQGQCAGRDRQCGRYVNTTFIGPPPREDVFCTSCWRREGQSLWPQLAKPPKPPRRAKPTRCSSTHLAPDRHSEVQCERPSTHCGMHRSGEVTWAQTGVDRRRSCPRFSKDGRPCTRALHHPDECIWQLTEEERNELRRLARRSA